MPLCIALPLCALFLRDPPKLTPASTQSALPSVPGKTLSLAVIDYRFYLLALSFLAISGAVSGTITNLVPLLEDHGYAPTRAAATASIVGLMVIAGRLIVGGLVDRFWAPLIGLIFLIPPAFALLLLALGDLGSTQTSFAIATIGLAVGAEVDLNAYLVSRYFGLRSFGQIYGIQYLMLGIGAGIASPLFGLAFDRTGSYALALTVAACGLVISACSLLALGRYPNYAR